MESVQNIIGIAAAEYGSNAPEGGAKAPPLHPKSKPKPGDLRYGRSKVSNGSSLFARGGDSRGAWARRWKDLYALHLSDYAGPEYMSEAELAICSMVAVARIEMEQLAARMSEGKATPEDVDLFNRLAGNCRRHLETLGLQRRPRPVDQPPNLSAIASYIQASRLSDEPEDDPRGSP